MIYTAVLFAHSWWRWLVMLLLFVVVARASVGWLRARDWTRLDERLHRALVAALDLQLALGLMLYLWLSPFTHAFFAAPRLGMKHAALRFFGVEHIFAMVIAVGLVHVGRVRSRRVMGRQRHQCVFRFGVAALVVILGSVPWPFLPYARPLFRAMTT